MDLQGTHYAAIIAVAILVLLGGAMLYWILKRQPSDEAFDKNDDLRHFQRRQQDRRGRTSSWLSAAVIIIVFFGLISWRTEAERDLRIPGEKLQKKALAIVTERQWNQEPKPYRIAFQELREKIMQDLSVAPFQRDDATLEDLPACNGCTHNSANDATLEDLPACNGCTHNSANDAEVRALLKGPADVCMNTVCYEAKVKLHAGRVRARAESDGIPIVIGDAAKKIAPRKDKLVGFVDLDDACSFDDYPEPAPRPAKGEDEESPAYEARLQAYDDAASEYKGRTYRQLLGDKHKLPVTLIEDPKTKRVRELVPLKQVRELLRKKEKISIPAHIGQPEPKQLPRQTQPDWQEEKRKRDERHAAEVAWRSRVLVAVAAKCAGPLKREEIVDIADMLIESDRWAMKEGLHDVYGGKVPEPSHLKDAELGKFIRLALVAEDVCRTQGSGPTQLLALAKRFKVDVAKVKAQIAAEAAAKPAGADKPKAAAPAKKKAAKK